jgi:CheY-like chemotaxis protein
VNILMLKSRGYEGIAAYSGEEGLEIVGRERPDVVLLDIMMPGMDGFETCRRLKSDERTRDIPVIFVTAMTSGEYAEEAFAAGGNGFLGKPFKARELFKSIGQVCDRERNGVLAGERAAR